MKYRGVIVIAMGMICISQSYASQAQVTFRVEYAYDGRLENYDPDAQDTNFRGEPESMRSSQTGAILSLETLSGVYYEIRDTDDEIVATGMTDSDEPLLLPVRFDGSGIYRYRAYLSRGGDVVVSDEVEYRIDQDPPELYDDLVIQEYDDGSSTSIIISRPPAKDEHTEVIYYTLTITDESGHDMYEIDLTQRSISLNRGLFGVGTYSIRLTATDILGNTSDPQNDSFYLQGDEDSPSPDRSGRYSGGTSGRPAPAGGATVGSDTPGSAIQQDTIDGQQSSHIDTNHTLTSEDRVDTHPMLPKPTDSNKYAHGLDEDTMISTSTKHLAHTPSHATQQSTVTITRDMTDYTEDTPVYIDADYTYGYHAAPYDQNSYRALSSHAVSSGICWWMVWMCGVQGLVLMRLRFYCVLAPVTKAHPKFDRHKSR